MSTPEARTAYEEWVRSHAAELYRFAYRLADDHQVAEDLVQETFVEAWRSMVKQRPTSARAWLFQILRYRYAHLLRNRKSRLRTTTLTDEMHDSAAAAGAPPGQGMAEQEFVQTALQGLTPEIRETFLMVFMEGLKCREVAEALHIPIGTVLSRLSRARVSLRERLGREPERRVKHKAMDCATESEKGERPA
jgi:RNA polymerase sigma-70 factor (ECF subfamily)